MVKKTLLFNKILRFKKGILKEGHFFSDQNLLKNQISIDDINNEKAQEDVTADKLGEATQEVAKQKTKKKKIINTVTFLLNIAIVACILIFQLFNSKVESFGDIIEKGNFKWWFGVITLICFAMVMFLDTFRASTLLKQSSGKGRFAVCYKMNAIGRYWDSVTPMSTGGQPFQVFYLNKHGVDAATAISIPLARYVVFQIAWTAVSLFVTIYSTVVFKETNLVSVASYIGFALNLLVVGGVWILSVSKKIGKILVAKGLKLLQKMRIIKSYEKVYDKVMDTVNGFQTTMKLYMHNIGRFAWLVFLNFIHFIFQYSMPFFIYLMLGGVASMDAYVTICVYAILVDLASGFVPLPGGSGMSEVAFTVALTPVFPEGTVFWGLLLWRFMNYYIYLLQGIFVIIYDKIWGNKKYQWQKKKWELEAESNKFKQNQLKKYNKKNKTGKIRI